MIKALTIRHGQTTGTVFGRFAKRVSALVGAVFVATVTISCVTPSPAGESADISVIDYQEGDVEKGQRVRWGGTIAQVLNKEDFTVLEIVSRPLWRSGRTRHNDATDGRFIAEINGFVDPEIASPGRDISVIGTVSRIDDGKVGEADYRYPVMAVFDYQFWEARNQYDRYGAGHYYLFSDRYWHHFPHRRRFGLHGRFIH